MDKAILNVWQTGCFTDTEICEVLNVTHYDIRAALAAARKALPTASLELKLELRQMYDNCEVELVDGERIAEELQLSPSSVRRYMLSNFRVDTCQAERLALKDAIKAELAKGTPQTTIASMFGVSQAMVSKLNPTPLSKPRGSKMSDDDWTELLSQYPRFNVTELARMYRISRASIYRRINK